MLTNPYRYLFSGISKSILSANSILFDRAITKKITKIKIGEEEYPSTEMAKFKTDYAKSEKPKQSQAKSKKKHCYIHVPSCTRFAVAATESL